MLQGRSSFVEPFSPSSVLWERGGCRVSAASFPARPNTGNAQSDAVQSGLCRQIKRLAIVVTLRQVVRMLRAFDDSQVFTFGRDDPQSTRTGNIEVSLL